MKIDTNAMPECVRRRWLFSDGNQIWVSSSFWGICEGNPSHEDTDYYWSKCFSIVKQKRQLSVPFCLKSCGT